MKKFDEFDEGAFRYWCDCNSEPSKQLSSLQSFTEGRRYEYSKLPTVRMFRFQGVDTYLSDIKIQELLNRAIDIEAKLIEAEKTIKELKEGTNGKE